MSPLCQKLSSGGRTVEVEIYRLEGDAEWHLELVDEFNNSTCWDDTFATDAQALTEAKKAVLEERISAFVGPEDGKTDNGHWK